jgi:transcriptional regulator with XRE-family HTH domain
MTDDDEAKVPVGNKIKALRSWLDLTQEQVAARSGGLLKQESVTRIERGRGQLRSYDARAGLAKAFNLRTDELERFLRGTSTLEATVEIAKERERGRDAVETRSGEWLENEAPAWLEPLLLRAVDPRRHTMRDIDAVRRAMSNTFLVGPSHDMLEEAREWLDAAARIHAMKRIVTTEALLVNVTSSLVDRIRTDARVRIKLRAGVVSNAETQAAGNAKVTVGKTSNEEVPPPDPRDYLEDGRPKRRELPKPDDEIPDDDFEPPADPRYELPEFLKKK